MTPERPARTLTKHQSSFNRAGPEAVNYNLSVRNLVTITIPPSSKWTSGPHWHEKHSEYLQIVQGKAIVTLGKSTWIHSPSDGIIEVKRGQIHEWKRYENASEVEDLIVHEWTDPADGQKEVFFRMLNSFLMESEPQKLHHSLSAPSVVGWLEQYMIPLQLFVIFAACDNWPVILGQQGLLGWTLTHLVLGFATSFGRLFLGLQPQYNEYISSELRNRVLAGSSKMKETNR